MANRTVKDAKSIKGTNPQYLIEKIIRTRIYDCKYWKEECFALSAELLVDKAMELRYIGGVHGGNVKPSPFLCLVLKMLQIQPDKDIIVEFIKNEDFKYVRALGAYYMRLTGTALDCYNYLEPLLNDNRKLRRQNREGAFELTFVDEFIDELLREERSCDVILPRLQKRHVLEENNEIQPRVSVLEDSDDDEEELEEEVKPEPKKEDRKPSSSKSRHDERRRHRSPDSDSGHRDRDRRRDRRDSRERDRGDRDRKSDKSKESRDKRRDRDDEPGSYKSTDRRRDRDHDHGRDRDRDRGDRDRSNKDRDRDREKKDTRDRDRGDRNRDRDKDRDRGDRDRHGHRSSRH